MKVKNSSSLRNVILPKYGCVLVTHCNSVDCSLPGSSVHGILQARILEWVAIPFPRGTSQPRDQTHEILVVEE